VPTSEGGVLGDSETLQGLLAAISAIGEEEWTPIPYWLDGGADVAVIRWRAFKSRTDDGVACRLVVRRVKPTPGSQLALIATYSYHAFITDMAGDTVTLDSWHRAHVKSETDQDPYGGAERVRANNCRRGLSLRWPSFPLTAQPWLRAPPRLRLRRPAIRTRRRR
jgi:hypothetical protein